MKKIFIYATIAAMMAMIIIPSCKKDDNDEVKLISHTDSAKIIAVMTKSQFDVFGKFSPRDGVKDINVGAVLSYKPGVALNQPFDVTIPGDITFTYRYDLTACTLTDQSGTNLITDYKYNEQDTTITITNKTLAEETQYKYSATIALMQQIDGQWQPVVYNGKTMNYQYTSQFTTGKSAEAIRTTDILFSYPIDRQYNYMPDEYKEGYIMLSYKYPELFENTPASDLKIVLKNITDDNVSDKTIPYTVKESNEVEGQLISIDYSLKDILFDPCQIYHLAFYCGDKNIYNIHFRTSQYRNLKSKMADCDWYNGYVSVTSWNAMLKDMQQNVYMDEGFDIFEYPTLNDVDNNGYSGESNLQKCLIYFTADLDNCEWYQNSIFKSLYTEYQLDYEDKGRVVQYPPIDAYMMINNETNMYLTDADIENKYTNPKSHVGAFISKLVWFMDNDIRVRQNFNQQRNQSELNLTDNKIKQYIQPQQYSKGDYPYTLSFRLPGKNIITYSEKHVMTVK